MEVKKLNSEKLTQEELQYLKQESISEEDINNADVWEIIDFLSSLYRRYSDKWCELVERLDPDAVLATTKNGFDEFICEKDVNIVNAVNDLITTLADSDTDCSISLISDIAEAVVEILEKSEIPTCRPFYEGDDRKPCYVGNSCKNKNCVFREEKIEEKQSIKTPRGTFTLAAGDEIAELKNSHFGYHHEHNGYVILADGQRAFAVTKEDYEKYYW